MFPNAKKFLEQVMADEALCTRIEGKEPPEVVKIAGELNFDVTEKELGEAVRMFRQEKGQEIDKLNMDELDTASGGGMWNGEDAPNGHEMGCVISYHHWDWSKDNNTWCRSSYYCISYNKEKEREHCLEYVS